MHQLALDCVHAARYLRRHPAFWGGASLTLALGIGAATVVFTLVHTALLRPLPVDDPDSLVWMYNLRTERDRAPFSLPDLDDYRAGNASLAGLAAFTNWAANLTGAGPAERIEGTRVAGHFFALIGARAFIGRAIEPDDERGDARVVVLTHGLWKRRFGADLAIVGKTIGMSAADYTVVGVMPPDFVFPFRDAELAVPFPLHNDPRRADRGANFLRVVARLKPGVTIEQAKMDLDAIASRLQKQYPEQDSRKIGVTLYPLHAEIVRDYEQILWTLLAAVMLVLAIGCGNVANLMLVRGISRMPELSLRISLGATRLRIVRQLAVEALLVAGAGCAAGVALTSAGLGLYRAAGPASFPRIAVASVSWEVLAFACALALGIALLSGVAPAAVMMHLTGLGADGSARSATVSRPLRTACRIFIGLQVAGSAALVVSMGLVTQSFIRLQGVDPGFDGRGARWVQLSLPPRAYPDRERIGRFADALRDRLLSMPAVRDAGAVSLMPLTGLLSTMDVAFPDRAAPPPDEVPQGHFRIATPGYFRAAGIPVLSGRTFTASDLARGRPVAIVSRSFASRHWPGEAAVGKTLQLVLAVPSAPLDVIGVVADVKQFGLDGSPTADVYVPLHQMPPQTAGLIAARMYWIVRTDNTARVSDESIREAVTAIDRQVAASAIRPLEDAVRASLGPRRLNVRLLEAFGLVAVLLSALGVYAVTSFSAGTRQRELAIRTALGAGRGQLRHLLVRDELRALAIGLIAGLLAAFLAAPVLEPLLFDTNPANLPTYIVAGAVLLVVGLVASLVPARHASRTDPARLLRA